jgi:hypothetical protein
MGADEFARAMIERDEDIGAAFPGRDRLGHVRHLIDPSGHDLAVMGMSVALDVIRRGIRPPFSGF